MLVGMICLALAACGGGGSSGGGSSGGQSSNPPPSPGISVSKSSIDFGAVVVGQTAQRKLTVSNTGNTTLDVTAGVTGFDFSADGTCTSLAPGDTCDFTVQFSPTEQRDYSVDLSLDSSATVPDITLTGTGQGLNVEISSASTECTTGTLSGRVIVSDATFAPIINLDKSRFSVSLNGSSIDPSAFTLEAVSSNEPVSVGLAVDWSRSLAGTRSDIAQRTEFFLDQFRDTDTAGVFRFASQVDGNAQDFIQTDAAGIQTLKDALYLSFDASDEATLLWDAADTVLDKTITQTNAKRAVVLISDGIDNTSTATEDEVIAKAVANNITFFTIGFGDVEADVLVRLADETGGVYYEAPTATDLDAVYDSITSIVTNQYSITFTNPDPNTDGQLTVTVMDFSGNQGEDTRGVAACP